MNKELYVKLVKLTESSDFHKIRDRVILEKTIRLDHAADGLVTEAGEFKDILKKWKFYGKDLDRLHLLEELGDILWYVAIALDELDSDFAEIMMMNIHKLQARYGIKFNEEGAIIRDLTAEKYAMEQAENQFCNNGDCMFSSLQHKMKEHKKLFAGTILKEKANESQT